MGRARHGGFGGQTRPGGGRGPWSWGQGERQAQGKGVNYGSRQLRLLQSGQVGNYVLLMVLGIIVLLAIQFFIRK